MQVANVEQVRAMAIRVTCEEFGISEATLTSKSRSQTHARARHVAMAVVRSVCSGASYPEIGSAFSVDHTSVMHAVRRVGELRELTPTFERVLGSVMRDLSVAEAEERDELVARRPARAPAAKAESTVVTVTVAFTGEQHDKLRRLAERRGTSIGDVLRGMADTCQPDGGGRKPPSDPA